MLFAAKYDGTVANRHQNEVRQVPLGKGCNGGPEFTVRDCEAGFGEVAFRRGKRRGRGF